MYKIKITHKSIRWCEKSMELKLLNKNNRRIKKSIISTVGESSKHIHNLNKTKQINQQVQWREKVYIL